jgi:Tfp pilus assembly protein PilV
MKARVTTRPGFTVLETTVALAILATALVLVAQIGLWSWRERARSAVRLEALELAANIMESARAAPWEALTPQWAARHKLTELLDQRLADGELTVRVEPDAARQGVKRVTVEIRGRLGPKVVESLAHLVGTFSARSAAAGGGKP